MTDESNNDEPKNTTGLSEEQRDFLEALRRGEIEFELSESPSTIDLKDVERFLMAEITFAELIGLTQVEAHALAEVAYNFIQEGKLHEAKVMMDALAVANPHDPDIRNLTGNVYHQLDYQEAAIEHYTAALEEEPNHMHALVNRADLFMQRGEYRQGIEDLKAVIEQDPEADTQAGIRARALVLASRQKIQKQVEEEKKTQH